MILKVDALLDVDYDIGAEVIAALIERVFKDNSHLGKLIICEVKEVQEVQEEPKKHSWEFYMNGTYCKNCGQQIGTDKPCQ